MAMRAKGKPFVRQDRVDPNFIEQLTLGHRSWTLAVDSDLHNEDEQTHPRARIVVSPPVTAMELTTLTTAELQALQDWLNRQFEFAKKITRDLDAIAQEAAEQGDRTWKRLWRPDPQLVKFRDL